MRYDWMDEYLLAKRAVTKDLQAEWNWIRYKIGDRMFAAILLDDDDKPYYEESELEVPDNWLHDRYLNIPMDSLFAKTERAVRQHHGVCWEDKGHGMAIVGIAHDDTGEKYFIMKNSWGTDRPYGGLEYISFKKFKKHTVAVEMTKEAYGY